MSLRARNGRNNGLAPLTISDFLPVYFYRTTSGALDVWLNWPVLVALLIGAFVARYARWPF